MRLTRWAVTLAATVASTYALDALATAAGVLLVASGLLSGVQSAPLLLAFLAASYVAWGAGLAVNLGANWRLLQETGTSTNVLSKAAHDVAATRTQRVGPRKVAAAVGYVGTEIAKEGPYYLGAFGAALTDAVSSADAIIFLAGANLGAAIYELGLARLTRLFLAARARRSLGSTARGTLPSTAPGRTRGA